MKRKLIPLIAAAAVLASSGAHAVTKQEAEKARQQIVQKVKEVKNQIKKQTNQPQTTPRAVPEIDVTAGTQAGALILGSLLLVAERSRRRASQAVR